MFDTQILKDRIYEIVQFIMSNKLVIEIEVKTLSPNTEYKIESSRTEAKYTSSGSPNAVTILTNLANQLNANTQENISANVVGSTLEITKDRSDMFWFFKLSTDLMFLPQQDVIWQDQNSPQPDIPYVTLKIIQGPNQIGIDDSMDYNSGTPDNYSLEGMDAWTLNVQTYGEDSLQIINEFKVFLQDPELTEFINSKEITFLKPEGIIDVTILLETTFESRHSLDLIVYTKHASISNVSIIEDIEITKI